MKKAAQAVPNKVLLNERLQRGLSQQEMAEIIGTTRINISRWECGITIPNAYFRQRLCQLFEKSLSELELGIRNSGERVLVAIDPELEPPLPVQLEPPLPVRSTEPVEYLLLHKKVFPENAPALFILLIALFVSVANLFFLRTQLASITPADQRAAFLAEVSAEKHYFQLNGIGISDGRFVFDTFSDRSDGALKRIAASQLQLNDKSGAVNSMTQAISVDVTDGEEQIYNENLHVLQTGGSYITIVLGLAIDSNPVDLIRARSIMEAAFLAQHQINTEELLPHGVQMRILIANSGGDNNHVADVAQFIANRVNCYNPDHIVAVVGWPFSSQTMDALSIITGAHIPMISQTASSVLLSGSSPYFFRVNPNDAQQGMVLGREAIEQLHAKTILVMKDPIDPYSVSLSNAFTDIVQPFGGRVLENDASFSYFIERQTTTEDYQRGIVQKAISAHADVIFLPGFDVDAIHLAHAIGNEFRRNPQNRTLANLKIISGDAAATSLLLGNGDGTDATVARSFPQDMQRLIFSSFAHLGEWAFVNTPIEKQPVFFSNWVNTYHTSVDDMHNYVDEHAILTFDAVQVIAHAAFLSSGSLTGTTVRGALASLGTGNVPAFQGVSGQIVFNVQGDVMNKAIVILDIECKDNQNNIVLKTISGTFG